MSDELFRQHCRAIEQGEFADVFRRLRLVFGPKPRMVLAKSLLTKAAKPKTAKPAKPAPKPVIVRKPQLSDRELAIFSGDVTVRGLLTGSAAHEAQKIVDSGGRMPAAVRATLLRSWRGGKTGQAGK